MATLMKNHRNGEPAHFRLASTFLTRCQVLSPYVREGLLRGVVCPWEIEGASPATSPVLEDFHDTLEAIWVWSHHRTLTGSPDFDASLKEAWAYVLNNHHRFPSLEPYDASHVLLASCEPDRVPPAGRLHALRIRAVESIEEYLSGLEVYDGREYHDPFWLLFALCRYGKSCSDTNALRFVRRIRERWQRAGAFRVTPFNREPRHIGPGGHDFFSSNANKILAFSESSTTRGARRWLEDGSLRMIPDGFVNRHVDENPWNAHMAASMASAFNTTGNSTFLGAYFSIMDELRRRDKQGICSLPRQSNSYRGNESWVAFFWSFAYAELCRGRE